MRSRAGESSQERFFVAANAREMSLGPIRMDVVSRDVVCDAFDCDDDSVFRKGSVVTVCLKRVKKVLDALLFPRKISSKVRAPFFDSFHCCCKNVLALRSDDVIFIELVLSHNSSVY